MTSPLFVDCYQGDLSGKPRWDLLAKLGPPYHGAIVKATEGTWYSPQWFDSQWHTLRHIAGDRYADDWFRGAYHFLKFDTDGAEQAELYCKTVERGGGWGNGDFWPIVDVELGSSRNSNQDASRQEIIDCTTAFAKRCTELTGRKVMLYGNGAFRDKLIKGDTKIAGELGCSYLWLPRWTQTLPREIYERAGWTLDEVVLWQFGGDGDAALKGYPKSPPGFGKVDMNVLIHKGGLEWLRANLWAEDPSPAA